MPSYSGILGTARLGGFALGSLTPKAESGYSGVLGNTILGSMLLGQDYAFPAPTVEPSYTGILGDNPLGGVFLGAYEVSGSMVAARVTQEATEVLYVSAPIVFSTQDVFELVYASTPTAIVTQYAIEILHIRGPSGLMTQMAFEVMDKYVPITRMTQIAYEIIDTRIPDARLTEYATEVMDAYSPNTRMTQDAMEVLYQYIAPTDIHLTQAISVSPAIAHNSFINKSLISAITVTQRLGGGTYTRSVTSNIFVSQIVTPVSSVKHLSITSNITVTPTIISRHDYALAVTSDILVTQTIAERTNIVNQSVISNIIVTPEIRIARMVSLSVTSNINVASIITHASNVVSMSVTSNITVTNTIAFRNTVVRISVVSNLNAAQTGSGRSDIVHQGLETDINVSSIIVARNTNVPADVLSTLTLTATIFARSTIVHMNVLSAISVNPIVTVFNPNIAVESDVHITQAISTRNTVMRLALQSNVVVTPTVRHSPNEQNVQSNIFVDGSTFNTAIKFYIDPIRYTFVQPIYLDQTITGGSSNRNISVQSDIVVTPTIRDGFAYQSVISSIEIRTTINGGSSTRSFSLQDNIAVSPSIFVRDTIIRQSLIQHINVNHEIINTTNEIPLSVQSDIIVDPTVSTRLVQQQNILHALEIHQNILARPDNNHQSVIDTITVTPNVRSSPNYQTVISAINVSSRVQQLHQFITSSIHVDQQINLTRTRLIIQQAPITQTLIANRIVNRTIRSDIAVTQAIKANHDYVRTIIQHLPVYDTFYPLDLSFSDNPVLIPVAIGTIVSATLMVIRGQHGAIQLPPAQLNDSVEAIGKMNVRKSMDGTAFSYVQKVDRQKLTYKWLLSHLKVYELRTFIGNNISDLLTMVNWKGETWIVRIVSNPFEFSNQGVWEKDKEFAEVEIQFEGKKVGG